MSFSLKELQETHAIDLHWRSYELRPKGSPPIPPAYMARIEASRPRFKQMMWELHGVDIQFGRFGINSHDALVAAKFAEMQGDAVGKIFHDAAFRAYWLDAQNIEDRTVLQAIGASVGLDGGALLTALDDPQYTLQVDTDIMQAYNYGLSGVPALIFENKYLVSGAQPVEVLRDMVAQIEARSG